VYITYRARKSRGSAHKTGNQRPLTALSALEEAGRVIERPAIAQECCFFQHAHFAESNLMRAMQSPVSFELMPRGACGILRKRSQEVSRARIRKKEEFPPIQSKHFRKLCNSSLRRTPMSSLQVSDERHGHPDASGEFLLGQVQQPPAFPNQFTELVRARLYY
jgi:hypothetical protein